MAKVTRKLLVVVCDFETVDYLRANLPLRVNEQVYELPSAEELGRIAMAADPKPPDHFILNDDIETDEEIAANWRIVGQAILDALTKGTP